MEAIYKENRYGYMEPTKETVTRCENCRFYADGLVKFQKDDVTGSYCRQWRAYVPHNGYCFEGKEKK